MGKLSTAKPGQKRDRLLGDGDGLFLRIRPHGTKTWIVEYDFQGKRTKYTIGGYSRQSAPGDSIPDWLRHGQQSLSQARSIAGCWKASRQSGHDPVAEWEALLSEERRIAEAKQAELEAEEAMPTVNEVIAIFMDKIMIGKKSAPSILYRLNRLSAIIGDKKIRDVTRQDVIAALDQISDGQRETEVCDAEWSEFDLAAGLWKIPASRTKTKRSHLVHLSSQAQVILENIKPITGNMLDEPLDYVQPDIHRQPITCRPCLRWDRKLSARHFLVV